MKALNLPASFSVQFYEGTRLTLAAQLQLNEVVEVWACMGGHGVHGPCRCERRPCREFGFVEAPGRSRQDPLLESGVASTRVVLNYFGEERAQNRGALDRRVEVAFFVEE